MPKRTMPSGWYAMRWFIFERDGFACQVCGQTAPSAHIEVDHVIAVSDGGTDDPSNLRTMCFSCNRGRNAWLTMRVHRDAPNLNLRQRRGRRPIDGLRDDTKAAAARRVFSERPSVTPRELAPLIDTTTGAARVMLNRIKKATP